MIFNSSTFPEDEEDDPSELYIPLSLSFMTILLPPRLERGKLLVLRTVVGLCCGVTSVELAV